MNTARKKCLVSAAVFLAAVPGLGMGGGPDGSQDDTPTAVEISSPADRIVASLSDAQLRELVSETLERNPGLASLRARARSTELRAARDRGLPDPLVGVTAYLKSPETRTGPQILSANVMQTLPWRGKRGLKEQVALAEATALHHEVEAQRLRLVTKVRGLYYEHAFLARYKAITQDYEDHLGEHEEISRTRYATGTGSSQDVVKIQAEITRAEVVILDIDRRRVVLEEAMNALRDRPASVAVLPGGLPVGSEVSVDYDLAVAEASAMRPEIAAADARIERTRLLAGLAEKEYKPDFRVGATYAWVEPRDDVAGELIPPEGNGDDIFGIQGGISIPVWRKKRAAAVEEAAALETEAWETKRNLLAEIVAKVGGLSQQIPLTWRQLRLLEDILVLQAEESVRSGQSGYRSGTLNALDMLDAEHVLFETHTAVARARADYGVRLAELEGEVGEPVLDRTETER